MSPQATLPRTIRTSTALGRDGLTERTLQVQCPDNPWPSLDACVRCRHFRGYALDPCQGRSAVACANEKSREPPPVALAI